MGSTQPTSKTVSDAFDATMTAVKRLEDAGVKVKITPTKSQNDEKTVKQYDTPDRIEPNKWVSVSFFPKNDEEAKMIYEEGDKLRSLNISFDTGGGCGSRDWELDWSFTVMEDMSTPREGHEIVENVITELETKAAGEGECQETKN